MSETSLMLLAPRPQGGALPLMLIFHVPVPVEDKDQWPFIGGFLAFLDSNASGSIDGAMINKH